MNGAHNIMIQLYESQNKENLFSKIDYIESKREITETITIRLSEEYQSIDGFGASFTDSSAYLIDKVLSGDDTESVMKNLFDPKLGIGLSLLRNPMGASDYARDIYSYNDLKERHKDEALESFSIEHDKESIIPLTKKAFELNSDMKLIASPWSAPGWMKDSYTMVGGKLLKDYYKTYANYFVKFIKSCQNEGVPVYAITPQNEPLFVPSNYPGMEMLAHEEADFVKNYLKPAFIENFIDTKIFGYDHNWDRVDYAYDILDTSLDSFDGTAWHWYGGKPVSQFRIKQAFPDKEIHFTEGSGGEWIPEFEPAFSNVMRKGIEIIRNHSKSFILWNIALDENNGPTVPGFGKSTCRGLLKINQQEKTYEYTLDYYALAHFSKHLRPGSKRVNSSQEGVVKNVAFKNTEEELVVILFNDSSDNQTVRLNVNESHCFNLDLSPKSAVTFVSRI